MKILLLGKNGQVGWELQRSLQPLGELVALDRHTDSLTGWSGDVADFVAMDQVISRYQPDVVVNATAYTAVDKAESERDQADLINHRAVRHLAQQCQQHHALLVHYSTDYVFDGQGQKPWQENDATHPINAYGQTKRDGEIALAHSGAAFINFRSSWVYGSHGNNFIKTLLTLAQHREQLNLVSDQIGVPTSAALMARISAQVIQFYNLAQKPQQLLLHGHYHLAPQGETSWYHYAQFIVDQARAQGAQFMLKQLNPIASVEYPSQARRPLNSRLNTHKLQTIFKIQLPHWQAGVNQTLLELMT